MNVTASAISVPALTGWKYANSLPEVFSNFSDSDWIIANHTTTNLSAMLYGDGTVLYGAFSAWFPKLRVVADGVV